MTVWAEEPHDGGSAVWGCTRCEHGGWCSDHTSALMEARTHATNHSLTVTVLGIPKRGPRPDYRRDRQVIALRAQGHTIRAIAEQTGLSAAGVLKALRRQAGLIP